MSREPVFWGANCVILSRRSYDTIDVEFSFTITLLLLAVAVCSCMPAVSLGIVGAWPSEIE